jgi:NADPH-dependent F420 reductase
MRVGVLGAGNFGKALAAAVVRSGHGAVLGSRHPDRAAAAAREAGAAAAASPRDAVRGADVVVLAVPYDAVAGIAEELGEELRGRTVVDVTNRFDPRALDGTSNAELVQAALPQSRVVKALNTVMAARLAAPVIDGVTLDGFLAGDDAAAKAQVTELLRSLGLHPVDAGPLVMARALEAIALLGIQLNMANGWTWQTGWKLLGVAGA